LNEALRKIAPVIIDEASRLNIDIPTETFGPEDFPGITTNEMLKYDIDDDAKDVQKRNIVKIANEFLSIAASFDPMGFYEPYSDEELPKSLFPKRSTRWKSAVLKCSFTICSLHLTPTLFMVGSGSVTENSNH
jgi:hypothetical protein